MQYSNFGKHVEDVYNVTLDGWPASEKPTNPSALGTTELKLLHSALLEGTCKFRPMNSDDKSRRQEEREKEARLAAQKRAIRKARKSEQENVQCEQSGSQAHMAAPEVPIVSEELRLDAATISAGPDLMPMHVFPPEQLPFFPSGVAPFDSGVPSFW
jgi:hypothetical protein